MSAVVTGVAVALPGTADPEGLLGPAPTGAAPVDPTAVIGRKGLRFNDRATRLGLHLAHGALTDAGLLHDGEPTVPGDRIATVVSSNLGNADTVCRAVQSIAKGSTMALRPMDTPNASSNITASETAIRYRLRGPNLTVCNGGSSGLDALRWAAVLLRSGRADHVLVTGVEPDNEVTRRLVGGPVADGGAAVVLSRAGTAPARARLGAVVRTATPAATAAALRARHPGDSLWLDAGTDAVPPGERRITLADRGELSGALGVVQCAAAVGWFARGGGPTTVHALAGRAGVSLLAPGSGR
ncbi:beta-ketoacyl synthase N-terminal-like domain-containing protein [Streptomyces sp. NPDC058045]|uniref:beta-ketoacyl synthase N-terminal-like domain-containing protein n=1 Tax=Streptomyces sp. NPDC058045 TaxID=3346311 RepID=UPI0036E1E5B5